MSDRVLKTPLKVCIENDCLRSFLNFERSYFFKPVPSRKLFYNCKLTLFVVWIYKADKIIYIAILWKPYLLRYLDLIRAG